jgi:uncharacterized protein (TIGR00255 family)
MIKSMTGFGAKVAEVAGYGKISVELRSTNHKFLETVLHLPEGFLSLEERMKKEIEARIKRGRVTCALNISGPAANKAFVNKPLLKNYLDLLKNIRKQYGIEDEVSINTLIHLPGVLALDEQRLPAAGIWPRLKTLLNCALDAMEKARSKEGRRLCVFLKNRAEALKANLNTVKTKFRRQIKGRLVQFKTDDERAAFLKDADITEEIERLSFHIANFKSKLAKSGPVGKELDFIAQEMQREANTMAAKSISAAVSAKAVQMKSSIEKIREQVQNIE